MNAEKAIVLARKHVADNAENESSARFCLFDAINQYDKGEYDNARLWAAKSLSYSVGIAHKDYKAVSARD